MGRLRRMRDRGVRVVAGGAAASMAHGFVLSDGTYTTIDAPGGAQTLTSAVNDHGQVIVSSLAPTSDDPFAGARGFALRQGLGGPFEEVRFPGVARTIATGIDVRGRIIGTYENPDLEPDVPGARVQPADPPPGLPAGLETWKETR
jgi:hypothetical protein